MEHAALMSVFDRFGDFLHDRSRFAERNRTFAHRPAEVGAGDVIHGVIHRARARPDIVNRNDPRMFQLRDGTRLSPETFAAMRVGGEQRGDRLEGNEPIEADLPRQINDRHPASAEDVDQFVITNSRPRLPPFKCRSALAHRGCLGIFPRARPFERAFRAYFSDECTM